MSGYNDLRAHNDDLLHGDSGFDVVKVVEDAMDILKVFSDELVNARVFEDGLVAVVIGFIMSGQPFDGAVIDK